MRNLTQSEQNKVNTLINLVDKELEISKELAGMELTRHESGKNFRACEKLEAKQDKVFGQFSEKYKKLPEHCSDQVETYSGYIWEEFQQD